MMMEVVKLAVCVSLSIHLRMGTGSNWEPISMVPLPTIAVVAPCLSQTVGLDLP